jgi:hypothetical protein
LILVFRPKQFREARATRESWKDVKSGWPPRGRRQCCHSKRRKVLAVVAVVAVAFVVVVVVVATFVLEQKHNIRGKKHDLERPGAARVGYGTGKFLFFERSRR